MPIIAALAAALAMVCIGEALLSGALEFHLTEGTKQALAGAMLIAGALVFGVSTRRRHDVDRLDSPQHDIPTSALRAATRVWSGWMSAAALLSVIATAAFAIAGESTAVVLAWIGSIAALLVPEIWKTRMARWRIGRAELRYLALLSVLLTVALITRTYKLSTLPYDVDGDFASVGLQARALAAGEQHIFAYGWAGVPALGYLFPALTMKLFGDGLAGLNASGVIEGLLVIVGVYLLGRQLFHPRVGLLAAALLTISYTHLAASRQSSYVDPVPFLVYSLYFLLVGLRDDRRWALLSSGAVAALCFQMYPSGRILAPIIAVLVLHRLRFNGRWLWQRWRAIALWALAAVITLGPMLIVFVRDSETFTRRAREVFILSPAILHHQQSVYQTDSLAMILFEQARRSALLFHYYPDTGTQFRLGVPFLDPFTAALFTLGVGYALFRWRRAGPALLLVWTALTLALGSVLTANPPYWPHLIVLLPPAALLAALALNQLYEIILSRTRQRDHHRVSVLRPAALALLLAWVGVQNWETYVAAKGDRATARTRIARYVADRPLAAAVFLVSNDFRSHDREFDFVAPGRFTGDLTPTQAEEHPFITGHSTALILTREQDTLLHRLEQRYPAASIETHTDNDPNEVAFYVFRLP